MSRQGLHQISVPAGSTDGDVVSYNSATDELELAAPVDVDRREPLTSFDSGGAGILFAADGHIIYVEAP